MGDEKTLASFDADTQQRATDALARFLGIYHLTGNVAHPDELGAAVQAALGAAGGDASADAFEPKLFEELLHVVYLRMADCARRGHEGPEGLDPKLRRTLVQKYGPLPAVEAAPGPQSHYVYQVKVDKRTFEVSLAGPKVDAEADVSGGPLGDDLVPNLLAAADGSVGATETTHGRAAVSGAAFKAILEGAVDVQVNGPVAVR